MGRKRPYDEQQFGVLQRAAKKQTDKITQRKLALAMGITQQSVSALLDGKYWPSPDKAEHLAILEGFESLEDMIGEYRKPDTDSSAPEKPPATNLDVCIRFHQGSKTWSPWTIAAARAGYFADDVSAPEWVSRLDALETKLAPSAADETRKPMATAIRPIEKRP